MHGRIQRLGSAHSAEREGNGYQVIVGNIRHDYIELVQTDIGRSQTGVAQHGRRGSKQKLKWRGQFIDLRGNLSRRNIWNDVAESDSIYEDCFSRLSLPGS